MVIRYFKLRFFLAVFALSMTFTILAVDGAFADEKQDKLVHRTLVERTESFCEAVLPTWFVSEAGIDDVNVRSLVTDCYMGHARLAILGVKSSLSLDDMDLSEVPAALLHKKIGINLDIYRPLAGRVLQTKKAGK